VKVTEMLSLLSAFDEVYASSSLTAEEKAGIGAELLLRLPHEGPLLLVRSHPEGGPPLDW